MIFAALTSKLQEISTPRVSNLTCNFEATAQGDTGNFEAQPLASKLTNFDISCYNSSYHHNVDSYSYHSSMCLPPYLNFFRTFCIIFL